MIAAATQRFTPLGGIFRVVCTAEFAFGLWIIARGHGDLAPSARRVPAYWLP